MLIDFYKSALVSRVDKPTEDMSKLCALKINHSASVSIRTYQGAAAVSFSISSVKQIKNQTVRLVTLSSQIR